MPKARLVYFTGPPTVITVSSSSGGEPLREPPHLVVNQDGKIAALGQEAETAAKAPGMQLMRFPDVAAAWQQQRLAATGLSFYWMTVEFRDRSDWMALLAGLWPPLQSYLIIHPAEGAQRGLGEPQAKWLRHAFRHAADRFAIRQAASRGVPNPSAISSRSGRLPVAHHRRRDRRCYANMVWQPACPILGCGASRDRAVHP